jgi:hypothetical protein
VASDVWVYLHGNVGITAPSDGSSWPYLLGYVQNDNVVWPTNLANFEIIGLSNALFLQAGPVWIKATKVVSSSVVWLPDPTVIPEVYVPGFWGILLQNNPDTP